MNKPPKNIPKHMLNQYTMGGKIHVKNRYFNNSKECGKRIWTTEQINDYIKKAKNKESIHYPITDDCLYEALSDFNIKNKNVLIVGSQKPGYEGVVLQYKAHPFTIEYNEIECNDNRIQVIIERDKLKFDYILSISSIEHSGLGRYGDKLYPNGDIATMQELLSYTNENAILFLSIPIGKDELVWNAHRVYGSIRLPLILNASNEVKKWTQIAEYGQNKEWKQVMRQHVFVLKAENLQN